METVLLLLLIWLGGAFLTVPALVFLETLLCYLRGREYQEWWKTQVKEPGASFSWMLLYGWPLAWIWWLVGAYKGLGVIDRLALMEEQRRVQEQFQTLALNRLRSRQGHLLWTFSLDLKNNTVHYILLVSAGKVMASHIVSQKENSYTIFRVGVGWPLVGETPLFRVGEAPCFEDGLKWCEQDKNWLGLCLGEEGGRQLFLLSHKKEEFP